MLLQMFAGSLLPYIEGLDSWLFEGTLDDPCEEVSVTLMFNAFLSSNFCFNIEYFVLWLAN